MSYLSDIFDRWEQGPYAMKAMLGCCFEDKPGTWFVQLRVPAVSLWDQTVLATMTGNDREETIARALTACGADELIDLWPRQDVIAGQGSRYRAPKPQGLVHALARCCDEIVLLCEIVNLQHDEI